MTMTMRERILAVYRGETPDVVPYMLDLSHWFYHKNRIPWDLSVAYDKPEYELIALSQAGRGRLLHAQSRRGLQRNLWR